MAGSKKKAKIRIHVNDPAKIFQQCTNWGNVQGEKADDMWKQQKIKNTNNKSKVAIVTDSGADISEENDLDIHVVPVRYNFGDKRYIDKVSQTTSEFFPELFTTPIHPPTSPPVPGDFTRQYQPHARTSLTTAGCKPCAV